MIKDNSNKVFPNLDLEIIEVNENTGVMKEVCYVQLKNVEYKGINDGHKKLVGIITNRDLKFETDFSQKISDCMTSENLVTAKEGVTLEEAKKILAKARKEKLPIVDENYNLVGLITIKDIEKAIKYPLAAKDAQGRLLCGAAIGVTENVVERAGALLAVGADFLVLDSAHGHSQNILNSVEKVKNAFPEIQLIAGNIATAEALIHSLERGDLDWRDIVKSNH